MRRNLIFYGVTQFPQKIFRSLGQLVKIERNNSRKVIFINVKETDLCFIWLSVKDINLVYISSVINELQLNLWAVLLLTLKNFQCLEIVGKKNAE